MSQKKMLKLGAVGILLSQLSTSFINAQDSYNSGTYVGRGPGYGGDVVLKVKVDQLGIVDIKTKHEETPDIGGKAIDELIELVKSNSDTQIQTVSGATISSEAFQEALGQALSQAKGEARESQSLAELKDGTYLGSSSSFGIGGPLKAKIIVENNKLKDVVILEESDSKTGEFAQTAIDNLIPRIIENQSLAVDAISGATVTSNAIKECIKQAITEAGGDYSDWFRPIEKSTEVKVIEDIDVLVIGLGGSGVLSYCSAADSGAKVFGVETTAKVGGNSSATTGPMAINSRNLMEKENDGLEYADPDRIYDLWTEYVDNHEKEGLIYKAVYESGSALDYYIDYFDFKFENLLPSFADPESDKLWTTYEGEDMEGNLFGSNKTYQFQNAIDKAKGMHPDNDYLLETTATDFIFDDKGKAIGISAESYDGTVYQIYAKSFIIATGGFIGNADMMNEYLDGPVNTFATLKADGTGINLGESAGGELYNIDVPPMIHIKQVPNLIRDREYGDEDVELLYALALNPDQLALTINGDGWEPEEDISYAPEYKYYTIYSQEDIDEIMEHGLSERAFQPVTLFNNMPFPQTEETQGKRQVDNLEEAIELGIESSNLIIANSKDEVANIIGSKKEKIEEEIPYESDAYYVFSVSAYAYGTVGGLDVDENFNLLDINQEPIDNIFVTGQDSMGVTNTPDKVYTPWGGQAQSWTFVSGKNGGENAAKYAQGK